MPSGRNRARTLRVFTEAYGHGPWSCSLCDEIVEIIGRRKHDGNVHHRDGDKSNDTPENLSIAHHDCHARHHAIERDMSALVKQQWCDGKHQFVPQSAEVRAQQAASLRGRTVPQDVRDRIAASLRGRTKTDEHREHIKAGWDKRRARSQTTGETV